MLISDLIKDLQDCLDKYGDAEIKYSGEHQSEHGDVDSVNVFADWDENKKPVGDVHYYLMDFFAMGEIEAGGGCVED